MQFQDVDSTFSSNIINRMEIQAKNNKGQNHSYKKSLLLDIPSFFQETLFYRIGSNGNLDTSVFLNQSVFCFFPWGQFLFIISSRFNNACEVMYWDFGRLREGEKYVNEYRTL